MAAGAAGQQEGLVSDEPDPEALELQLLLEGILEQYGYDFRDYATASIRRRIMSRVQAEGLNSISGLQERVLHDPECMDRLLSALTVHVTSMFRDPGFYVAFREKVVPSLQTYPFARIWHAGCSTGEEVYSLAILLGFVSAVLDEGLHGELLQGQRQGHPLRVLYGEVRSRPISSRAPGKYGVWPS